MLDSSDSQDDEEHEHLDNDLEEIVSAFWEQVVCRNSDGIDIDTSTSTKTNYGAKNEQMNEAAHVKGIASGIVLVQLRSV